MGDANTFRSGRELAAWIRLVPRQTGSGGKVQLLGISKRGDMHLRKLLIHGARSVLFHTKEPGPWLEQIEVSKVTQCGPKSRRRRDCAGERGTCLVAAGANIA